MGFREAIERDLKDALKARDSLKVSVLRLILSSIKNKEIDKRGELSEEEFISVLHGQAKKRKEAIEAYEKGKRADLQNKEEEELKIIETYLPKALSEEELLTLVRDAISEAQAASPKDTGKVMKILMPKVKGRTDGKLVNQMVAKALGGKWELGIRGLAESLGEDDKKAG
jgi:uncharacterized protein YqeY